MKHMLRSVFLLRSRRDLHCRWLLQKHSFATLADDGNNEKLQEDVKMLGDMLAQVISHENPKVMEVVNNLHGLSQEWRNSNDDSKVAEMITQVKQCDNSLLLGVSRSFTHFLALANTAENNHRVRKNQIRLVHSKFGLSSRDDSCGGCIKQLLEQGHASDMVYRAICEQKTDIVLTAHPTEVSRRTLLRKQQNIQDIMQQLEQPHLTTYDSKQLHLKLKREINSIWFSDELRRKKPTPVDEAKAGFAIVENVLWDAVPNFLRKLNDVVQQELGKPLPLDSAIIKFSSWMGGDRDGNANVTPAVTLEVSLLSRWMAATLFKHDINNLKLELSLTSASKELKAASNGAKEPYRAILTRLEAGLDSIANETKSILQGKSLQQSPTTSTTTTTTLTSVDFRESLLLLHHSLVTTNNAEIADGLLVDVIRRLNCFGLALLPLDIRQESARHTEALNAITSFLEIGSYVEWNEETRCKWLQEQLSSKRPLLPRHHGISSLPFSQTVIDTLATFELLASLHSSSLGAYIISHCEQVSDILAVALLQQDAGIKPLLRVVPLFETLNDLVNAPSIIDSLFRIPEYRCLIDNKHEIMVGYSDSAKDAGRIAAAWAQYESQVKIAAVGRAHGVDITFFHGKGGTVGRGGNPALFKAIVAHPPNTICGRFRVTEQGEIITQNFGCKPIAERTLDLFTAAVLVDRFNSHIKPKEEWFQMMNTLSSLSCNAYREVIQGDPRFISYFRQATPERELVGLNLGSRPASRGAKGGIESLRAIPWIFSWTQTRLNLPTWLGVGQAIASVLKENQQNLLLLKEMYEKWSWFETLIDLLEMILVKSELHIATIYDEQLVTDEEDLKLGRDLRLLLTETAVAVLQVSGHVALQENNPVLLRSLLVRNPFVDPLNIIQTELLRRIRFPATTTDNGNDDDLKDALLVTINGIATGMRNSG